MFLSIDPDSCFLKKQLRSTQGRYIIRLQSTQAMGWKANHPSLELRNGLRQRFGHTSVSSKISIERISSSAGLLARGGPKRRCLGKIAVTCVGNRPTATSPVNIADPCRRIECAKQSILTPVAVLAKSPRTNRQWSRMGNLLSCSGVRDRGTKREFASRRVRKSSEARFDSSDTPNIGRISGLSSPSASNVACLPCVRCCERILPVRLAR
jgi:hypothetical protein